MSARQLRDAGLLELGVRSVLVATDPTLDAADALHAAAQLGVGSSDLMRVVAIARADGYALDASVGLVAHHASEGTLVISLAPARAEARAWAGVAHELRNALTTIVGWADVAAGASDIDVARHAIETVRASAREAMDVAPLLLEDGAPGEPADVASSVVRVIERFAPIARARGVEIVRRRIDAGTADTSHAALSSIVANLVKNAVEACARGGRVEVGVRATSGGVEIVVEDDGAGMSAETLGALFGSRAIPVDTSRVRGIGVSVVRALVERANGTIRATSTVEAGSCVRVTLPRARRTPSSGVRERASGRRVLVVDDAVALTDLIVSTLEARGAKVRVARTPADALAMAEHERFDAAFVDLDLGESSGAALVRTLVSRGLVARVVVMTGASAIPDVGGHALLRKPFDLTELEALTHVAAPSARTRGVR